MMSTILDISTFVYQTGTLTIAPGDTTAVFDGAGLSSVAKDGDYLFAGGSLAIIETVTDDTHAELFTEWAGSLVTAGPYLLLKASLLRYHTALIGYDSAAFLALLDGTTVWYAVEGDAPDPSIGEEGQRALKSNVTPWKVWLKTGGVWVEQAGSPGGPGADGATIIVQDGEPSIDHTAGSLWIDADSSDIDVYLLGGSPLAWEDTGVNLKGSTGPAAWLPPEAWVTATAYVVGPPANTVTQGGETYVCLVAHTSGTFATDLAASKWIKVAAKGADGSGTGDVVGPASATDAHIVLFDTTSGKKIQDSGKSLSDLATAAQGAKADSAVQSSDLGSAAFESASSFATAAQGTKADTAVQLAGNQSITGGFSVAPNNLGNITSFTVNPALGNYQYGTNHGAATWTAPALDCAVDILVTNDATAGSITFSGFTVASGNTGDALTTTSGQKFIISIRRIGGSSTYVIKALQ